VKQIQEVAIKADIEKIARGLEARPNRASLAFPIRSCDIRTSNFRDLLGAAIAHRQF
jgi:hypothetical protein